MTEPSILFTGDFCSQGRNEPLISKGQFDQLFNDLLPDMKASDLVVVDLESPLVTDGVRIPKTGPHLKSHPFSAQALAYGHVGLVALANNHIMDYGGAGLTATLQQCAASGIATVGAGTNLDEARKPFCTELQGKRVAILNVTENEWSNTHGPEPGANPLDTVKNFYDIRKARSENDVVVVVFHGGHEHYDLPSPRIQELFRFYVDAGASAVIGHHTHITSGYEVYRGAPLFYSLGNFCFDWPNFRGMPWNVGMAVRLRFGTTVTFDVLPFRQSDQEPGVRKLLGGELRAFESRMEGLNQVIADEVQLRSRFEAYCQSRKDIYNIYMEPYRNHVLASLRKRKWIPSVFSAHKRRLILNIARCESHRDVFFTYLSD